MLKLLNTVFFCLIVLGGVLSDMSLNNYGDSSYPDRCVLDIGDQLVLLKYGESHQLEKLPCTTVFCIGDGWGMLETCDYKKAPDDCYFSEYINPTARFPDCCKRRVLC